MPTEGLGIGLHVSVAMGGQEDQVSGAGVIFNVNKDVLSSRPVQPRKDRVGRAEMKCLIWLAYFVTWGSAIAFSAHVTIPMHVASSCFPGRESAPRALGRPGRPSLVWATPTWGCGGPWSSWLLHRCLHSAVTSELITLHPSCLEWTPKGSETQKSCTDFW